jgi:hypothetical protein
MHHLSRELWRPESGEENLRAEPLKGIVIS